jgi:hypothetical protein
VKSRITYVEARWPDNRMKSGRIGRLEFSKSGVSHVAVNIDAVVQPRPVLW